MRIGLLSCTSMKQTYACKASKMYDVSPRFHLAYEYAKRSCDVIYILSSKYGLIHEDTVIETYNETLNEKSDSERKNWARLVLLELEKRHSIQKDKYIILAGMKYCEYLIPFLPQHERPLKGVKHGNWIPTLTSMLQDLDLDGVKSDCDRLHEIFNDNKRLTWFEIDRIPFDNGIYIMFENGEKYKDWDRIVRIGTHTSDNRLKSRLKNHFLTENKDGSILRKNIGLSMLRKTQDPYLSVWGLDTSKPEVVEKYSKLIDKKLQADIERRVTQYLRANFSFICIPIDDKADRLRYEEGLISALSHSQSFHPSDHWLGLHSPKSQIVQSGLWNISGLDTHPLTKLEIMNIYEFTNGVKQTIAPKSKEMILMDYPASVPLIDRSTIRPKKTSTRDIKNHILSKLNEARQQNIDHIDLISGRIHRELGLINCMPSVCSAMRQVMGKHDTILKTTPSGNSSTITIRYFTMD